MNRSTCFVEYYIRGDIMLKDKCIERGLSLSKLSEKANISKSYLSLIEREEFTNLTVRTIIKLAKAFEIDEFEIYTYYSKIEHLKMNPK